MAVREFGEFVAEAEPRLRQALLPVAGAEGVRDAVADALAYAWEHWERVRVMDNPAGYLYRVAQSRLRSRRRTPIVLPTPEPGRLPDVEPRLPEALAQLTERQRVAVFLVAGCDWTYPQVAALMGISVSSVRNHLSRGLERLRALMEVPTRA